MYWQSIAKHCKTPRNMFIQSLIYVVNPVFFVCAAHLHVPRYFVNSSVYPHLSHLFRLSTVATQLPLHFLPIISPEFTTVPLDGRGIDDGQTRRGALRRTKRRRVGAQAPFSRRIHAHARAHPAGMQGKGAQVGRRLVVFDM